MTSATSVEYATPANWQDFERLSRALLSEVYGVPLQRWGRPGQRQDGVDIWGTLPNGRNVAIQCKGRSKSFGKPLTIKELDAAVLETASFPHRIDELLILTTAADDTKLHHRAAVLTNTRLQQGKSGIAVWGWNTLSEHIGMHEGIQKTFYAHWFSRINLAQRLVIITTTIFLLTLGGAGLFLFHEKREGTSQSRTMAISELTRITTLLDGFSEAYGSCEQAMTKDMFVFTGTLRKYCTKPVEKQLAAFDKQVQASTPYLDAKAIEELARLSEIMREDFRQSAIATQMTGFFEGRVINSMKQMCLNKKNWHPTEDEKEETKRAGHDAANSQLNFYFLMRDFILPGLASMKSRLLILTRQQIEEPLPASLVEAGNKLPKLLTERQNYKFEAQSQPLTLSVVKANSSRSINIKAGDALDFVESARMGDVLQRAMVESLVGRPKDIESLISCGVLKPAARSLGKE